MTSANGLLSTWKVQGVNLFCSWMQASRVSGSVNETGSIGGRSHERLIAFLEALPSHRLAVPVRADTSCRFPITPGSRGRDAQWPSVGGDCVSLAIFPRPRLLQSALQDVDALSHERSTQTPKCLGLSIKTDFIISVMIIFNNDTALIF